MRAVVRHEYGDTSVLRVEDAAEPTAEPGRVIVDVAAAGVNMAEWHLMSGEPTLARLAMGLWRPRHPALGEDVAGVVTAVGPGVTRFAVGDEVFGSARGSWAERASAREDLVQPLPSGVSFEQAAAVPMSGYTALQALRAAGDIAGKRVAITGAGGGVGSYAVQLACSRGAHVTAVCSGSKASLVRDLGAAEVIDYATTDPTDPAGPTDPTDPADPTDPTDPAGPPDPTDPADPVGTVDSAGFTDRVDVAGSTDLAGVTGLAERAGDSRRFDVVLDFAGGLPIVRWRRVIAAGGTLVLGGGEQGGRVLGPLSRSIRAPFVRGIRAVTLMASARGEDIAELAAALASGTLRSTHAHTYALADAAAAVDALRAAVYPGKIVLTP